MAILRYSGKTFTHRQINAIQKMIDDDAGLNRNRLSQIVCRKYRWRKPNGELKDMRCRVVLIQMERDGLLRLPAPKNKVAQRKSHLLRTEKTAPCELIDLPAHQLGQLSLEIVTKDSSILWNQFIDRYHYLGYKPLGGAQLRYFVRWRDQIIALFGFGAAAWKTAPRDRLIGWDPKIREENLHLIVNNQRFLILPWVHSKCLASKLLSMVAKKLPRDWIERYNYRPLLLETFVEQRFAGTSYRAANWLCVGETKGRGKHDKEHLNAKPVKSIWLYPLCRRFQERLRSTEVMSWKR